MDEIISCSIKHLKLKFFHFPDGWVEACIEFLFQEHKDNIHEMSNDKWCNLIEQQWLFTDLRDFNTPSLLNNLHDRLIKFTLVSCFQIMSFRDVSKSYYSQIQLIKGTVNENTSVTADNTTINNDNSLSGNRTLLLILTDGVNDISGFEFEPWPHIEINKISTGGKCRLKGPFIIRNKVAFLKQGNIELLGGEVEELSGKTQLSIVEEQLQLNTSKIKNDTKTAKPKTKSAKTNSRESTAVSICQPVAVKPRATVTAPVVASPQIRCSVDVKPQNICHDSDSIEPHAQVPDEFCFDQFNDDEDDEIFRNLSIDDLMGEQDQNKKENATPEATIVKEEQHSSSTTTIADKQQDSNFIQLIDIFHELSRPEANDIVVKQFRIKGMIVRFTTKLGIVKEEIGAGAGAGAGPRWNLEVLLADGSASVNCVLDDGFLAGKIGFSASRFQEMKSGVNLDRCKQSIKDFQENITKFNFGVFTLLLSDSCDKLCVVEHLPLDDESVQELRRKIEEMGKC